ncbi:DUF5067 domain-containing protein [Enterococcus dongliensis]|uniref:DUF5067 domain-containing protein n=1 Tax=Enterococcus dongliensis TaxID=2559925 RepID=UPI0028908955|nr:DUF5067 domain-containing protein [Enterococcus dongliensis]MDT2676621.1 DUF5067 domain-containing protein [Enterococcus dongliensis]MDT2703673.1 DUF5067 domain-containing protein [Enterococcus dongliensis]
MKKLSVVLLVCSTLLFSACSSDKKADTTDSTRTKLTTTSSNEKKKEVTFNDGVLETKDYKLKVVTSEVIQSPSVPSPGLYVTFELTNKSKKNIFPYQILHDISFKQKTDTSLVNMTAEYHSSDAFGEDIETVNKINKRSNDQNNELLPGKSIEVFEGYSLEDNIHEVQMLPDFDNRKQSEFKPYIIKLIGNTDSDAEGSSSSPTNQSASQEETYEQLKQRTLKSTPTDRVNWSNKEWEAFGMALSENGLAMDDNGYIITQAQKDQIEAERQKSEQVTESQGGHGAPKVVTSEAQAVQIAQSQFGDNNGAWTWGCMYEDERGYFVKATDPNDGTMTHTAKSVFVHYDGSVTEN